MAPAKGHLPVTPVHTEILIDSSVNNLPEIKLVYLHLDQIFLLDT